jgi:hypothetical protein
MFDDDRKTYGFNRADAEALAKSIRLEDGEYIAGRVRGGGGARLYRFTLNEDMGASTSLQADADILKVDGTDTGTDADVLDPLNIFESLENGDPGFCIKQSGSYYVIQAPCPGDGTTTTDGGSA